MDIERLKISESLISEDIVKYAEDIEKEEEEIREMKILRDKRVKERAKLLREFEEDFNVEKKENVIVDKIVDTNSILDIILDKIEDPCEDIEEKDHIDWLLNKFKWLEEKGSKVERVIFSFVEFKEFASKIGIHVPEKITTNKDVSKLVVEAERLIYKYFDKKVRVFVLSKKLV